MKSLLFLVILIALTGCYGHGGPAERAGATVDHAVYKVGEGVERTGRAIERSVE